MSVINQMLKDLDKRSSETNVQIVNPINSVQEFSPVKIVMVTIFCILIVATIVFYIWQLNSENNALRAMQPLNQPTLIQTEAAQEHNSKVLTSSEVLISQSNLQKVHQKEQQLPQEKLQPNEDVQKRLNQQSKGNRSDKSMLTPINVTDSPAATFNTPRTSEKVIRPTLVANSDSSIVTPIKRAAAISDTHDHPHTPPELKQGSSANIVPKKLAHKKIAPKKNRSELSVSRRQLSANELAKQKLARAEKAIVSKQIGKAEKLLEDVVIITPHDSQSRKKLAALWFGRQAYQDAVNLLSQGISLDSQDSSLRKMKARIHLRQGQAIAALNTLKPLASLKDEQYQIMLANTAQQAKHHSAGVKAYKMLISMQEEVGRWQLGLAVLYDKNSQFNLASKAYKKALTKNDLSVSSEQFAKQRIQAIGQ